MHTLLRHIAFVGLFFGVCSLVQAASEAEIEAAIQNSKKFLLAQIKKSAAGSLASYALLKAGVDKQDAGIQKSVEEVNSKCNDQAYKPTEHFNYEAGVDAMLLEAVDHEKYKPAIEKIAKFLIASQRPHGGWFYITPPGGGGDFGDTSISQYAILGLWAASRAGVDIPNDTWERAARWLMGTQQGDGGFVYHPTNGGNAPSSGTMTVAGTGSLLVIRQVLWRDLAFDDGARTAVPPRRFGILERIPEEKEKVEKVKPKPGTTLSATAIDKSIKEGLHWIGEHFTDPSSLVSYPNYYYYGVERVGALLDSDKLGIHDWYEVGANDLLMRQRPDGSWTDACGQMPATALTMLFLTKATSSVLHRHKKTPKLGGGLLVGGRGLPKNLDAVQMKDGDAVARKQHGPVDGLLAELEKSSGAKVEAAQEAIVETVQLEKPDELIGQVERLKRLAADKRVEVRRTAMWALGRTGNISVAPHLIAGLSDTEESILREASLGLCILSRRPDGCGPPPDPTDGLSEDSTPQQRTEHLERWKSTSRKLWTEWYLKTRPYDERDDRMQLKKSPR